MEDRPDTVAGRRARWRDHPRLIEEGVAAEEERPFLFGEVGGGEGERLRAQQEEVRGVAARVVLALLQAQSFPASAEAGEIEREEEAYVHSGFGTEKPKSMKT